MPARYFCDANFLNQVLGFPIEHGDVAQFTLESVHEILYYYSKQGHQKAWEMLDSFINEGLFAHI